MEHMNARLVRSSFAQLVEQPKYIVSVSFAAMDWSNVVGKDMNHVVLTNVVCVAGEEGAEGAMIVVCAVGVEDAMIVVCVQGATNGASYLTQPHFAHLV
jgi:hypothetical protein